MVYQQTRWKIVKTSGITSVQILKSAQAFESYSAVLYTWSSQMLLPLSIVCVDPLVFMNLVTSGIYIVE